MFIYPLKQKKIRKMNNFYLYIIKFLINNIYLYYITNINEYYYLFFLIIKNKIKKYRFIP